MNVSQCTERSATKMTCTLLPIFFLFLTFQNQKLKGHENKLLYGLASIEMPDLQTCNALQRLNTRPPSSSANFFGKAWELPPSWIGKQEHLGEPLFGKMSPHSSPQKSSRTLLISIVGFSQSGCRLQIFVWQHYRINYQDRESH